MRSDWAWSATASALCCVPRSTPGGKPVTALPGLSPRSPVMVLGPVLVMVDPARTAKLLAVPRLTIAGLAANAAFPSIHTTPSNERKPMFTIFFMVSIYL